MASRRLPDIFYNWISMVGALMAIATFSVIVLLLLIDRFVQGTTIYLGLLTFLVLPVFVVLGLVLIAAGGLLDRRRQARGEVLHFPKQIEIDLENPRHRNAALIWAVGTTIFLLASAVGTYRAYQETESVAFCGTLCPPRTQAWCRRSSTIGRLCTASERHLRWKPLVAAWSCLTIGSTAWPSP